MTLKKIFIAHLEAPAAEAPSEEVLAEYLSRGRAAWPLVVLDPALFMRHLARHAEAGAPPPIAYVEDLYLACACAHGVHGAVESLDRMHAAALARVVARVAGASGRIDDVLQVVREKVFVASDGREPRIADYAGRASLKSWLSAAAARTAISLGRGKADRAAAPLDSGVAEIGAAVEPELVYLRARYKAHVEAALRASLENLSTKHRALLRLSVRDGLSVDRLGAMYGIGRSTAARWVEAARRALLDGTREELHKRVSLTDSELDSLTAAVRSELQVSILRLLATET